MQQKKTQPPISKNSLDPFIAKKPLQCLCLSKIHVIPRKIDSTTGQVQLIAAYFRIQVLKSKMKVFIRNLIFLQRMNPCDNEVFHYRLL